MLTLSNLSCQSILAASPYLADVVQNPCNYDRIEIEVIANCCPTTYTETITIPSSSPGCTITDWQSRILNGDTLSLIGMSFKNVLLGTTFSLPSVPSTPISAEGDIEDFISNEVDTFFHDNLGTTTGSITGTVTIVDNNYELILSGLPEAFIPISLASETDGYPMDNLFAYVASPTGSSILTSVGLIITPIIISDSLTSFTDGVYHIQVTVFKPSGSRSIEANCLFVDCLTKCLVSNKLKTSTGAEQTEILMLHYGLSVGTNCPCDCDNLCDLYQRLYTLLNNTEIPDCGCN